MACEVGHVSHVGMHPTSRGNVEAASPPPTLAATGRTTVVVAGRYDLEREIGRGGMGAVWLGRDTVLGRDVALKRIGLLPGATTPDLERAEREARLAARLNHPHVVAVFDLVEDEGDTWLVMEYVEGITLSALIARDGALSSDQAAPLVRQAADALTAAHAAGIVHRDVKPSNIMVMKGGMAKGMSTWIIGAIVMTFVLAHAVYYAGAHGAAMGAAARERVRSEHDLLAAASRLGTILARLQDRRAA